MELFYQLYSDRTGDIDWTSPRRELRRSSTECALQQLLVEQQLLCRSVSERAVCEPTIDGDHLAGDEGTGVTTEIDRSADDLFALGDSPK